MHPSAFITLLVVGIASAGSLDRRDSFDCAGSGLCGSAVNFVRDCDIAVNTVLIRNDDINYGAAGSNKADGAQRGRCKIFIAGPRDCQRSGNQMWQDYQEIRGHGCARCGSKHWGQDNACRTTVNYVA
ncbi:unnamed protein product [Parascedosporium putredinis]|uniref:Killer toxin Kp4 domain-containing protein n=1 Tax=Parascedosporium putredinis TaxID=1442378 RepID=A0A9P1H1D3_9PEZI|nr:unnamed protein product [Parascedosporium putredinis]CAI7993606.1 unnamed protein product [Parascedosporium putredinis]